jgi:hypothetical protein
MQLTGRPLGGGLSGSNTVGGRPAVAPHLLGESSQLVREVRLAPIVWLAQDHFAAGFRPSRPAFLPVPAADVFGGRA